MAEGGVQRRLAAILSADVVGYAKLMGADEEGTLARLAVHREDLIDPQIDRHHGRIVKLMGDGILVEFASVVDAVRCAAEIQLGMAERNADEQEDRRIVFRIGINLGDIIVEGDDIHGDGVNVAARLEGLAEPGGICISRSARDQVRDKLPFPLDDLGEHEVKNIARPIRVFRVALDRDAASKVTVRQTASGSGIKRRRWAIPAAAAVVMIGVAAGVLLSLEPWVPREEPASVERMAFPLPDKPSIAVLPFDNLSGDPEQEYFSDGMTEQIIAELARFHGLFVVARNSTFRYKGRAVDVREVGRELGAHYVLEGSVRRASETIRVTAQLIDATSGAHLWAETYDRSLTAESIFSVQDEITEHVVGALADPHGVISRARIDEAIKKETTSLGAFECVLRTYAYRRTFKQEEHRRVRDCLERAVQLDPDYVDAWAWLALIYSDEYRYAYNTRPNALERSLAAAQHAVALDSTSQLAHWILARTYFWLHRIDDFLTEAEKAIALNPNNSGVVASCAMYMAFTGQWERGVELTKKAIALNPSHPGWYHFTLFSDHYRKGEYDQALAAARKINMPSFWWTHMVLAAVHGQLGHHDEAGSAIEKLLELYPTFPDKPREIIGRWNLPDSFIERMIDGLRMAGLPERSS